MFSAAVIQHWFGSTVPADLPDDPARRLVVVDPALPENRRLAVLAPVGTGGLVTATPAVALALGLRDGEEIDDDDLAAALARADLRLNGPDHVFHLPLAAHDAVRSAPPGPGTRALTEDDAAAFEAFTARAPQADLEEAYVELDHWLVVGTFVEEELVCVASAYPWRDTVMADLGVVALPEHRGKGLAKRAVLALSGLALQRGYEPQYRCQLDNHASVRLADAAGLRPLGTWDVVTS